MHTHADSDKKYGKGNEQFSPTDIESAKSENLDSYVFTPPNGKELKFDVKTDKVSRIDNGEIPYSKKKNANGRTYVVGNYTPQGNKDRLKVEEKKILLPTEMGFDFTKDCRSLMYTDYTNKYL